MNVPEKFINYIADNLKHTDLIEILAAYPKTPINILISQACLLYTSPSPRDRTRSRMPSSA